MSDAERLALDTQRVVGLKRALLAGDEVEGGKFAKQLFATNPEWILRNAGHDELLVRRAAHEIYDQFLRQLVFFPGSSELSTTGGELWRELMLPTRGVFPGPILISNARWLRMFGSNLPDEGHEELDPTALAELGFEEQAKALGRYCAVNDGVREIDFEALAEALDSRLRAGFVHWVIGVYLASPGNLADTQTAAFQARAARDFVARHGRNTRELAGSTMFVNMPYFLSYRTGIEPVELAPILNGQLTRRMVEKFGTNAEDPSGGRLQAGLVRGGDVILCPNWRDEHVAYRCMSTALEALRGDNTRVVMAFEPGMTAEPASAWQAETLRVTMPGKAHFLQEAGAIADRLEAAELDFLMYPEVTPNNATACLATRRLARVQAAGYGFPVTTGSPHMDYFVGGTEVEADGTEYTEQLVLLPGLGVSTTAPPLPTGPRQRGLEEDELRVATITSWQKLNPALLGAWEAILGDQPKTSLDVFSALTQGQASSLMPSLAANVSVADIRLNLMVPRLDVLDTLENADLYLDSFPYGGFNSLVEVLASGCPVVTLEGPEARHRFGAAMLRRLELPSFLIAKTPTEYVAAARRLLLDAGLRKEIRARIGSRERVLGALADPDIGAHFAAAVDWMREQGPRKGKPGPPVRIEAGTGALRQTA